MSGSPAQGRVAIGWSASSRMWRLEDRLSGQVFDRAADELAASGLYVDLSPWTSHVLQCHERA